LAPFRIKLESREENASFFFELVRSVWHVMKQQSLPPGNLPVHWGFIYECNSSRGARCFHIMLILYSSCLFASYIGWRTNACRRGNNSRFFSVYDTKAHVRVSVEMRIWKCVIETYGSDSSLLFQFHTKLGSQTREVKNIVPERTEL
jgi:hypothetical protein